MKKDYYVGLNKDSRLRIELDIVQVAKEICGMNYRAHRLLSAMVDELRRKNDEFKAKYAGRVIEEYQTSPLADGIEKLLIHTH